MRIIGGQAANRTLRAPPGAAVRPTPDRVKLAVFNSLGARVIGARVLDLFAGSGALGLECLSRAASHLTAVEKNARHAAMIRRNCVGVGLPSSGLDLRIQDAFAAIAQLDVASARFDLIFADPPFGEKNVGRPSMSFAQQLLDDLQLPCLLSPAGLFILGHARRDQLAVPSVWRELKILRHGDSWMRFLQAADPPAIPASPDGFPGAP